VTGTVAVAAAVGSAVGTAAADFAGAVSMRATLPRMMGVGEGIESLLVSPTEWALWHPHQVETGTLCADYPGIGRRRRRQTGSYVLHLRMPGAESMSWAVLAGLLGLRSFPEVGTHPIRLASGDSHCTGHF
jgi:hypothetical protein